MSHKILFAEDEKILGQLVIEGLQKHGLDVKHVSIGTDVLAAYREYKPQLCLLDIMLPGKDGYDVAKQLRAIDKLVPIIFLTAKVAAADVVKGFEAGGNDYIRKPFSIEELIVRIHNQLAMKQNMANETETEIRIGDILFMPVRNELHISGSRIELTYKDSAILLLLHNHRNSIVSRDYILQQVWGNDSFYNSRTLDVYINRLRKYFAGTANKIITLKGVGYRFLCE